VAIQTYYSIGILSRGACQGLFFFQHFSQNLYLFFRGIPFPFAHFSLRDILYTTLYAHPYFGKFSVGGTAFLPPCNATHCFIGWQKRRIQPERYAQLWLEFY
jgi:hypothetical protein